MEETLQLILWDEYFSDRYNISKEEFQNYIDKDVELKNKLNYCDAGKLVDLMSKVCKKLIAEREEKLRPKIKRIESQINYLKDPFLEGELYDHLRHHYNLYSD